MSQCKHAQRRLPRCAVPVFSAQRTTRTPLWGGGSPSPTKSISSQLCVSWRAMQVSGAECDAREQTAAARLTHHMWYLLERLSAIVGLLPNCTSASRPWESNGTEDACLCWVRKLLPHHRCQPCCERCLTHGAWRLPTFLLPPAFFSLLSRFGLTVSSTCTQPTSWYLTPTAGVAKISLEVCCSHTCASGWMLL